MPGQKGRSELRQRFSTPLLVLMGMVGLVLQMPVRNAANRLIGRAAARQKEIAIRLALGASQFPIIRQLLLDNISCWRFARACCSGSWPRSRRLVPISPRV